MFDRSTSMRGPPESSMIPNSEGVRHRSLQHQSAINENQSRFAIIRFAEVLSVYPSLPPIF